MTLLGTEKLKFPCQHITVLNLLLADQAPGKNHPTWTAHACSAVGRETHLFLPGILGHLFY